MIFSHSHENRAIDGGISGSGSKIIWEGKSRYLVRLLFIPAIARILGIPKGYEMTQPVTYLETGKTAVVVRLEGGYLFQRKMGAIGIREQKIIRLVAKHPFHGPVVVEVDGREITLGRHMAEHIIIGNPE